MRRKANKIGIKIAIKGKRFYSKTIQGASFYLGK